MDTPPRVGVLALQGDVREHLAALTHAGAEAFTVRRSGELEQAEGLVIPGGESTTISRLLRSFDLVEPIRTRIAAGMPTYGSCAGMILLADEVFDTRADAEGLGGLRVAVRRNAFGRQVDSFETDVHFSGMDGTVRAVFIRAPWVERVGPGVEVLARVPCGHGAATGRIVAVRQGSLLATSFHPEVTGDHRVHELFVGIVRHSDGGAAGKLLEPPDHRAGRGTRR